MKPEDKLELDMTELDIALERTRKGYRKPLPGAHPDQQQTASIPSDDIQPEAKGNQPA